MSNFQRTIKYIAIAFAILLAVGIVSGIANAAFAIVSAVSGGLMGENGGVIDFSETYSDVRNLDIDNSTGKLIIKTGDTFKVEAVNVSDSFEAKVTNDGTLKISDSHNDSQFLWFHFGGFDDPNSTVTVYLPAVFVAEDTNIESGAGSVNIEHLYTEELTISAGAGSISGNGITAEKTKIEGGFGSISFSDVNFTDTDLDCGVGSVNSNGVLTGGNQVNCGIGDVVLNLDGNVQDYNMEVDSGIGTISLNGKKLSDNYRLDNDADNSIKIDGGIGKVVINIGQ
jgi:hypothetical protein